MIKKFLLVGVNIKYFSNLFNLYLLALLLLMTLMASFYLPAPKTQMLAQLKLNLRSFVPAGIILCLYVMIRTPLKLHQDLAARL